MPKIDFIHSDLQFRMLSILTLSVCGLLLFVFLLMLGLATGNSVGEKDRGKIGLVILGDIHDQGWNSAHYEGMMSACREFNVELIVKDKVRLNSGMCPKAVQELSEEGVQMIYLASSAYATEIKDMLYRLRYIAFATNADTVRARNISSYIGRLYQARYLAGVLAGLRTKTNMVGYVAAMRNPEVNRGINAFTLGLRAVNPHAQVAVLYTDSWQDAQIEASHTELLIKQCHADIIIYHQDDHTVAKVAAANGVDYISSYQVLDDPSEHNLGAVIWDLDKYYRNIVQRFLKGEINTFRHSWQGIEADFVDLRLISPAITEEMRARIDEFKAELKTRRVIFSGEIRDNLGVLRCRENESISDKALMERFNWLVEGCLELN